MKTKRKKTVLNTEQRFVVLGSPKGFFNETLMPRITVCHDSSEVEAALSSPVKGVTWISFTRHFTDLLLKKAVHTRVDLRKMPLLTLMPPRLESIPALLGLFRLVCGLVQGFQWLTNEELFEAITRDDAAERFIGGSVDPVGKTLTLLRGDMETVVAPFSLFPKSPDGTAPDFAILSLTDYGRTVALGDYEASADVILYELDANYRRKLNKQRRLSERTFGASLLRLRRQRGLQRSDFEPVSAKEIARIERSEVGMPHTKTLGVIARHLGVQPNEIENF